MLKLIVGTQGNDRNIVFQVSTTSRESLQPLSSICSWSEPFRLVEHLAVRGRWNIPANMEHKYNTKLDILMQVVPTIEELIDESTIVYAHKI